MNSWFEHGQWLGNPAMAWVIAGLGALAGYVVLHGAATTLGTRLRKLAERTHRSGFAIAADVLETTHGWLLLLIAIAVALDFLAFEPRAAHALHLATYALVGIQAAFWASALLASWLRRSARGDDGQPTNPIMLGVVTWLVKFAVWITLLLALLAEGGVNITAFVASLGVGGVALALGLQTVLTDLFASISIGLDEPFKVGESIAFGDEQGTVTKVGIKSTRIQSVSGEELSISNSVLLKNLIHNYSRQRERRVVFTFRLPFDTPRDKIPAAIERVRGFIDAETQTRFDRGYLSGFGESGLDFEFVYYVLDPSYNLYVEIQHRINLKMLDAWDALGIQFGVPARTLHAVDTSASVQAPASK
jgi:small-conductance mechanosensitive channel